MSFDEFRLREHYSTDDERSGCGSAFCAILVVITLLLCMTILSACKTIKVGQSHDKDSVRVEYQRDSIYAHDSIFIDRFRTNDTVYLTKERWSIRYRDVLHTDTMYVDNKVVEVRTERYIPGFYKWSTLVCWIIIAGVLIYVVCRIAKAVYLRR